MEFLAAGLSSLISVFVLIVFVAGVMKLFQIHTVLTEIKDNLRMSSVTGRVPAPLAVPMAPTKLHEMSSGDDMLRALDAQMKWDESASRTDR
jgi:hypothetical protein